METLVVPHTPATLLMGYADSSRHSLGCAISEAAMEQKNTLRLLGDLDTIDLKGPILAVGEPTYTLADTCLLWDKRFIADLPPSKESYTSFSSLSKTEPPQTFSTVLLHLQKSRPAFYTALAEAWACLKKGGVLLVVGGNDLGIKSAVSKIDDALEQVGELMSNKAKGRLVMWTKTDECLQRLAYPKALQKWQVRAPATEAASETVTLTVSPGAFSYKKPDIGTALLWETFCKYRSDSNANYNATNTSINNTSKVLDLACGSGTLGLLYLSLQKLNKKPLPLLCALDVDSRACSDVRMNAETLGFSAMTSVQHWAAGEPLPRQAIGANLIFLNPPFHQGKGVNLDPAHRLFETLPQSLSDDGEAWIVANQRLPYEQVLSRLGKCKKIAEDKGYKILRFMR